MRRFYGALLNGHKVTAEKQGGHWLIGGDSDLSGSISVMVPNRKFGGFDWFTLKGCYLKHSDGCSDDEVEDMQNFLQDYLARKNDPECVAA